LAQALEEFFFIPFDCGVLKNKIFGQICFATL